MSPFTPTRTLALMLPVVFTRYSVFLIRYGTGGAFVHVIFGCFLVRDFFSGTGTGMFDGAVFRHAGVGW